MPKMLMPTKEQRENDIAKAERNIEALRKRYLKAKAVADKVKPELDRAESYLKWVQSMPVSDGETPVDEVQDEGQTDESEAQPVLFDEPASEDVFA